MNGNLADLWPRPRPMIYFAALQAVLGVGQGLLLGLLVPILPAVLRPQPDLAAAAPWLVMGTVGVLVYWVVTVIATPAGFAASGELGTQLRSRLLDRVAILPLGWFTGDRKGRFVRTVTSGATGIGRIYVTVGGPVLTAVCTCVTVTVVVCVTDPRLGLVLLATLPVAATALLRCRRITTAVVADIEVAGNEIASRAIEFGQAQHVLRAAGLGTTGTASMRTALSEHRGRYARGLNRLLGPDLTYIGVVTVGFVGFLVVGGYLLTTGRIGVATMAALCVLAVRFTESLGGLGGLVSGLGALDHLTDEVRAVLRTEPLPAAARPLGRPAVADIEFRDVTFGYEPGKAALSGVSFHCRPGTTTALIGPSGSGKSTIIRLVARFFDVGGGQVLIGGVDVREYDHAALLDDIAIIFQDVYLFDTTIEENVRLAMPAATAAELATAARLARLDEVVDRLPDGWQTRVGEGGTQLSGGERQRVSIARALLKRARIVLVDEAASALDPENEAVVSRAVAELARDPERTVIVIAHHPAMLAAADQVVALSAGQLSELGTPTELRHRAGHFARLHDRLDDTTGWRITTGHTAGRE